MTMIAKTWLALMSLTAGSLAIVSLAAPQLSAIWLALAVFAVAGLKAWLILTAFVGIDRNAKGWRTIFAVFLLVLGGLLVAFHATSCGQAGLQCLGRQV